MSEHNHHHHHHHQEEHYHHSQSTYTIQRGMIYKFLFASAMFSTIFLVVSVLMPLHRFFKKVFSRLFNLKFKVKGMDMSIYSVILMWILFCAGLFSFIKMQENQFAAISPHDSHSTRIYKHKNKCMLESELWMLAIIMIEWGTIFKYFKLLDYRIKKEEELKQLKDAIEKK